MGRVIGNVTYQADNLSDYLNALQGVDVAPNLTEISHNDELLQVIFNIS